MAEREVQRRRGRQVTAALATTVALYTAVDFVSNGPISSRFGQNESSQIHEVKEVDALSTFQSLVDTYTTAGPGVQDAISVLNNKEVSEQFSVNVNQAAMRTRYELTLRGLDQGDVPLDLLYPAITVDETTENTVGSEVAKITAYLGPEGPEVRRKDTETLEQQLTPEEMRRRAGDFVRVPEFGEAEGWEPFPARVGEDQPWQQLGIVKETPFGDRHILEAYILHNGKIVLTVTNTLP